MLHYILQTIVFQLVFLLIYDLFLKQETFFNWNRFYLLVSAFLSVVLPFVRIDSFKTVIPKEYIYSLPEVIIGNSNNTINNSTAVLNNLNTPTYVFSWNHVLILGCIVALILLVAKLYKLIKMANQNPKINFGKAILIELANSNHAFSFFNYIFLGTEINSHDRQTILTHELVHVKERHSLDLFFFELLKIIFWFNPLIYIYQKRIANLHEFIADSKAVKLSNKVNYYQNLLSQVFNTERVAFINPFFKQSLIKKRIIMLSKSKSKQIHLAKYLLLFPVVIGMLFYTSCSDKSDSVKEINNLKQYSYTLQKGEEMSEETKTIHNKYEAFLRENKDYVSWSIRNEDTGEMSFSVHPKDEERPIGMTKHKVTSPDGSYYTTYFNFPDTKNKNEKKVVEYGVLGAEEIPFINIEQVPIFPGCENLTSNNEQRICFNDQIYGFVLNNFNTELSKTLGLKGVQKIYTRFTISKEGNIVDIKSRAEHPELEKEVIRVLKLVPQVQPAIQGGKPVNVSFDLPISFNIQE